ncbi:MAG: S8 family serine peptidase [Acidobacteria bacterium]|nr:S8 family serine peptidase [Acidobacteriota bacterium]
MNNRLIPFILILVLSGVCPGQTRQENRPGRITHPPPDAVFPERLSAPVIKQNRLDRSWAENRLIVKFRSGADAVRIGCFLSQNGVSISRSIPRLGVTELILPEGTTVPEMMGVFNRCPDVEFVEPDYRTFICAQPNDTFFPYQYALSNTGQWIGPPGSVRGTIGADMGALDAWDETRGDPSVVVAVIDSGIDLTHPDLQDGILDGGWNFIDDNADVTDDNGHGTFITGVIAAGWNNGVGISGVAPGCRILPIKGIDAVGLGYASAMIHAIIWAMDQDVDIINLSVGAEGPSRALESALKYAYDHDVVVVASTGNRRGPVSYPAAYTDYCLAVSGTNFRDEFLTMSNYGPEVDVAAPGERVFGCLPTWSVPEDAFPYGFLTGTSIAAAHVSGLAALLRSLKPWLTAADVMKVIRFTADDVNRAVFPGRDDLIGYGRVHMGKALIPHRVIEKGENR